MKILMVVPQFFPAGVGGAERQCWKQAQALTQRGHAVTILTMWRVPTSPRTEHMEGVRVLRRGCYFSVKHELQRRLNKLLIWRDKHDGGETLANSSAESKPRTRWNEVSARMRHGLFFADVAWGVKAGRLTADVVHVHESHWIAGFAQWIAEALRVPVLCKEASLPVLLDGGVAEIPWGSAWRERRLHCRFIAMTNAIAEDLAAAGIPRHRIEQIPNGVEIPSETATPDRHADAIYVGNFTQGAAFKGFDVLLQAWGLAHRQEPNMKLRLYGRGDTNVWNTYADEYGCGNSVIFEGETNDIWAAHRQSGFLVIPSRQEGLSNALLEAMASGLPSVVSDIPGNTAAVRNGVDGLVVPVGDVEALASAMVEMYRDSTLRMRLGRAARERVETTFSLAIVAEKLEQAYQQAIKVDAMDRNASRK